MKYRGWTEVKGKGKMETYFVIGKQSTRPPGFQRQPSQYSSLAAVVYAMAQARRKHTGNTRKVLGNPVLQRVEAKILQQGGR